MSPNGNKDRPAGFTPMDPQLVAQWKRATSFNYSLETDYFIGDISSLKFYMLVLYNVNQSLTNAMILDMLESDFKLSKAESRTLLVDQIKELLRFKYDLRSATTEPHRQQILAGIAGLRAMCEASHAESSVKFIQSLNVLRNALAVFPVPSPVPVAPSQDDRAPIAGTDARALPSPVPASTFGKPVVPILCSKAELLRALDKHETYGKHLQNMIDNGELELSHAAKPLGHWRYTARFTDPERHAEISAKIIEKRRKSKD